eukprot:PhM_4_TR14952/c0_g1_i1/m.29680/K15430/TRM11, TRMT11; tRNA (guanine10-N2)-methyltransferase
MVRVLAYFAASLEGTESFRKPELDSIAEMFNFQINWLSDPSGIHDALCTIDVPSIEAATQLASRSVLLHNVCEIVAEASSLDELYSALKAPGFYETVLKAYLGPGKRFKLQLESWGHTWQQAEKMAVYHNVCACFPHEGSIDIKTPESEWWIFVDHHNGGRVIFTRLLTESVRRHLLNHYTLKRRPYIGTTSMPPELTFLMTNLAKVRKSHVVYDCFCGTGSTLVSAAHHGAYCFGADRDGRTMRNEKGSIRQNFAHYKLKPTVDFVRLSSEANVCAWRCGARDGLFDAILTDPPYGIREPSKKVDRRRCEELAEQHKTLITPPSEAYTQDGIETDLFTFAARALRVGGHLVFWHPSVAAFDPKELPSHPRLRLKYCLCQPLNLRCARQLVVLEKVAMCGPGDVAVAPEVTYDLRSLYFSRGDPHSEDADPAYKEYLAKRAKKKKATEEFNKQKQQQQQEQDKQGGSD